MSFAGRPAVGPAVLAAVVLALAALAGCGGGGGESSTAASSEGAATSAATTQKTPTAPGQASKPKPGTAPNPARQHVPEGHPTPGAKAVAPGVPVTRGGDNSIQAMGTEGQAGQRSQAVENLTAYLTAFSSHEWGKACSLASSEYRRQLAALIANATLRGGKEKPEGCSATLSALFAKAPAGALRAYRVAKALSFRIEGDHAYLIYRSDEGRAMFIAMKKDEGEWKVNVTQPQPFLVGAGK